MVHQIKTIKLVELNFIFKENALLSRKRKTNFSWPLTLNMQKRDHFRLLRHHYSESPVIPLSNDIWYRCVSHGFITFHFLIFYRWSISILPFIYIADCRSVSINIFIYLLVIWYGWHVRNTWSLPVSSIWYTKEVLPFFLIFFTFVNSSMWTVIFKRIAYRLLLCLHNATCLAEETFILTVYI